MVKLDRIYTRGGDKGKTSLGDGSRVSKGSVRIQVLGVVDETNAQIGIALIFSQNPEIKDVLQRIQNDLFDLGADLCIPYQDNIKLKITQNQINFLEESIDRFNKDLKPLTSFILPGGSKLAGFLHLARTVSRRAESLITALSEENSINHFDLIYMNRLSDLLFVLARYANDGQDQDTLWQPGKNG